MLEQGEEGLLGHILGLLLAQAERAHVAHQRRRVAIERGEGYRIGLARRTRRDACGQDSRLHEL